jgi:hypothetical protein
VATIPKLLLRLLSDESALAPWVPFKVVEKQGGQEAGGRLNVKVLELSAKVSGTSTEAIAELE